MEKETILARLRGTLSLSQQTRKWLERNPDSWIAKSEESVYFSEFRRQWNTIFVESCQAEIHRYFRKLGLSEDRIPHVKVYESYPGSWYVEAALVMGGTVASVYYALKAISEIPKIADGLVELKNRIKKGFFTNANQAARRSLAQSVQTPRHPLPNNPLEVDFVIDARPLRDLTAKPIRSHKIHLSVGVSPESFTLENLGEETLRDIRIGIFKSKTERHQWSYADSYKGSINLLSSRQTIARDIAEFRENNGTELDLSDLPLYVDCWVEDIHGIYLFRFYVEEV